MAQILNTLQSFFGAVQIRDIFDIIIVAFLIYAFLTLIRQTRSYFIFAGLLMVLGIYFISENYNLSLTRSFLQPMATFFVVILVIIFRQEIRHLFEWLASFGRRLIHKKETALRGDVLNMLIQTADYLVNKKIGALIVLPGLQPIDRWLEGGHDLNGQVSVPLLTSIFDPTSPGHDGAVVIGRNRVSRFAVHLPLAEGFKKFGDLGTRHRSALGLSEKTDALCIVVSEERGVVSVAHDGNLKRMADTNELKNVIDNFLKEKFPMKDKPWHSFLTKNVWQKAIALVAALALWSVLVFQAGVTNRDFTVPVEFRFLPNNYQIDQVTPKEVTVTFSGDTRDFRNFNEDDFQVVVNLSDVKAGWKKATITEDQIQAPLYFSFVSITPKSVSFHIVEK
ncbi:MAG TPA: diadenylate cyclase [Candidatus Paceibacterota bacterium]|nr:diadenylate cyclase [Candidatus Paceibacterota bacterium]